MFFCDTMVRIYPNICLWIHCQLVDFFQEMHTELNIYSEDRPENVWLARLANKLFAQ